MHRRLSSLLFSTAASVATLTGLGLGAQVSLAANPLSITGGLTQVVGHSRLLADPLVIVGGDGISNLLKLPAHIAGNGGVAHVLNNARLLADPILIVDKE
jgi:hypothetical protein